MEKTEIERINLLAKKAKSEGLSDAEAIEQAELRKRYIDAMKRSLEGELSNTYIKGKDGTLKKVTKKR